MTMFPTGLDIKDKAMRRMRLFERQFECRFEHHISIHRGQTHTMVGHHLQRQPISRTSVVAAAYMTCNSVQRSRG